MQVQWDDKILGVNGQGFEELALGIFRFQSENNSIYKRFLQALQVEPDSVRSIEKIPFLPVSFFKSHIVQTTGFEPQAIFESSGTTGSINSRHYVKDISMYEKSFTKSFELFYGSVKDYCIIGLLPSYVERKNSSLVYMVEKLIQQSEYPQSDFYLNEYEKLFAVLSELERRKQKTILIGVAFALLDFAEKFPIKLTNTIVMETGGMKGRRKPARPDSYRVSRSGGELIREEMHKILKLAFDVSTIHSEYGMTELLSQAYSKGEGIFHCPPWMKVLLRDEEDPLCVRHPEAVRHGGAINIIDLANIYSCSFIATDDAGRLDPDGSFTIEGRMDGSDLRGCSLMFA